MNNDCSECFHYGKSPVSGKVECCIKGKLRVCPGHCTEFVRWEE